MMNSIRWLEDEEHNAVSLLPQKNDIVKDVRLVYYAPDVYMPLHTHSVGQFSTLLSGQAHEHNINTELYQTKGVAEYKPVGYKHSNRIGPNGALFLSINLASEDDAFVAEFGKLNWGLVQVSTAKNLWKSMCSLMFQPMRSLDVDVDELVLGLISSSVQENHTIKTAPSWLRLAEQALHETELNIEQIADDVGVHRVHLSRVFQSHFGLSITEYRQSLALQKGISAILSHEEAISSASASAGFADQSHFTRVLKKQFGVTPKALRSLLSPPCVAAC
ncbi:helix-turn-helix domain-containing protein [Alteromonas facilis]|uniref:helix-turn-helix domain-containing protein n=1 Tax=Alteromonas facilis TaxID=2048004 RepID=UPI000C281914|nr:AraC family transcriptional regulator [Alteromonas facilis]